MDLWTASTFSLKKLSRSYDVGLSFDFVFLALSDARVILIECHSFRVHLLALSAELTKTFAPSVDRNYDSSSHVQPTQVDQLIVLSFCTDAPAFDSGDEVVDTRNQSRVLAVGDGSLSF